MLMSIGLLFAAYDSNLTVTPTVVRTDSMSEVCVYLLLSLSKWYMLCVMHAYA
jgi:hypothetical protein